jgi:exonuclease 3'-5' domain-containing protein 1
MMSEAAFQSDISLVNSTSTLICLLDSLADLTTDPPSLYIDLEGIKLSRSGSVSLIGLYVAPQSKSYIVDVHILGRDVFSTTNNAGCTLKSILESRTIPKVFFDIRNDSDALYSHYQISVNGIIDLQLLELALRQGSKNYVAGLAKCIEKDSPVPDATKRSWRYMKDTVGRLYDPKRGGSYEVFNERPIRQEILQYCAQDVMLLPTLWKAYSVKLRQPDKGCWRWMIREETQKRVTLSQSAHYDGQSQGKVYGPWDEHNIEQRMDSWNDDVMLMGVDEGMVLNENDEWVDPPATSANTSSVFTLVALMK